jgi:predicted porin
VRKIFFIIALMLITCGLKAQIRELNVGLAFQQTQYLYNENGLAFDYSCANLLNKHLHIKGAYVTSRLGSAIGSNALKQDNFLLGAHYYFSKDKPLQFFAGLNTGIFHVNYEDAVFDVLPQNNMLFGIETGLNYRFKFPLNVSLSLGYHLMNGNGIDVPGSLFPVYYKLGVYYRLEKLFTH